METRSVIQRLFDFFESNRVRFTIILVLFLIIEDIVEGIRPFDIDSFQNLWGTLGLILVFSGVALRSWSAGVIHKGEKLAILGPYSTIRHPLYVGSLLMALGFCIIINDGENIWFVLIAGFLLYFPTIRKEEKELSQKFGKQWQSYIESTGMFFPKKIPANLSLNWSLNQWLKNREYRACATSLAALIVLELIHELQAFYLGT